MIGMSTVTTKGQVTIPQGLRLMLGIVSGDKLYFEADLPTKSARIKKAFRSVADELFGSMANSAIPYMNMNKVRKIAGLALAKKYGLIK